MMKKSKNPSLPAILLAILIGVLLLVTAVPAIVYFPAQRFLLKPDEISAEILASDLPARLPDLVAGWMLDGTIQMTDIDPTYLSGLEREDFADIISLVAPVEWSAVQSALAVRQAQDYLLGRTEDLTITLDLTGVSQRLGGEALPLVAERIVTSWDACTAVDLADLMLAMANGSTTSLHYCQPPDTFRSIVVEAVKPALQQLAARLPSSLTFEIAKAGEATPGLRFVRWLVRLWSWTPWLAVGLAILLLLVLHDSLRSGMMGVGLPLSLAGVTTAGLALALAALRQSALTPWVESLLTAKIPAELATLTASVITNVFGRFCLSALVWGGAACVVGIGLVIASRLIRR